jgi:hypothetical protein
MDKKDAVIKNSMSPSSSEPEDENTVAHNTWNMLDSEPTDIAEALYTIVPHMATLSDPEKYHLNRSEKSNYVLRNEK